MKTQLFKSVCLFCICSMFLAACSAKAGNGGNGGATGDGRLVEAGPFRCLVNKDDGSGIVAMSVNCEVTVGNAQISDQGLATSVSAILQGKTLHDVCPTLQRSQVLSDPAGFSDEVGSSFTETIQTSGTGWDIQSVSCEIKDL